MEQPDQNPKDESGLTKEEDKHTTGCFISIFVLIIGIVGSIWFSDPPQKEVDEIVVGKSYNWNITTKIKSVAGLYNLNNLNIYLKFDNDSIILKSKQMEDKSWTYQDIDELDIEIISIGGIPVETGREEIFMKLNYTAPEDSSLIGRTGFIGISGSIDYPFFNFEDAIIGSFTEELDIKSTEYLIDEKYPMVILAKKNDEGIWKILKVVFKVLVFFGIIFGAYKFYLLMKTTKIKEK